MQSQLLAVESICRRTLGLDVRLTGVCVWVWVCVGVCACAHICHTWVPAGCCELRNPFRAHSRVSPGGLESA